MLTFRRYRVGNSARKQVFITQFTVAATIYLTLERYLVQTTAARSVMLSKPPRDCVRQRCISRAQRTVCDDTYCCACTRARDGTARHVAGERRAASAFGGEGERTPNERDR
jgi:hypothetical protein